MSIKVKAITEKDVDNVLKTPKCDEKTIESYKRVLMPLCILMQEWKHQEELVTKSSKSDEINFASVEEYKKFVQICQTRLKSPSLRTKFTCAYNKLADKYHFPNVGDLNNALNEEKEDDLFKNVATIVRYCLSDEPRDTTRDLCNKFIVLSSIVNDLDGREIHVFIERLIKSPSVKRFLSHPDIEKILLLQDLAVVLLKTINEELNNETGVTVGRQFFVTPELFWLWKKINDIQIGDDNLLKNNNFTIEERFKELLLKLQLNINITIDKCHDVLNKKIEEMQKDDHHTKDYSLVFRETEKNTQDLKKLNTDFDFNIWVPNDIIKYLNKEWTRRKKNFNAVIWEQQPTTENDWYNFLKTEEVDFFLEPIKSQSETKYSAEDIEKWKQHVLHEFWQKYLINKSARDFIEQKLSKYQKEWLVTFEIPNTRWLELYFGINLVLTINSQWKVYFALDDQTNNVLENFLNKRNCYKSFGEEQCSVHKLNNECRKCKKVLKWGNIFLLYNLLARDNSEPKLYYYRQSDKKFVKNDDLLDNFFKALYDQQHSSEQSKY